MQGIDLGQVTRVALMNLGIVALRKWPSGRAKHTRYCARALKTESASCSRLSNTSVVPAGGVEKARRCRGNDATEAPQSMKCKHPYQQKTLHRGIL